MILVLFLIIKSSRLIKNHWSRLYFVKQKILPISGIRIIAIVYLLSCIYKNQLNYSINLSKKPFYLIDYEYVEWKNFFDTLQVVAAKTCLSIINKFRPCLFQLSCAESKICLYVCLSAVAWWLRETNAS